MLYFLVFLLPFIIVMWYLIDQNNKLKKVYVAIYRKIWQEAGAYPIEIDQKNEGELDAIITNDSIKKLENDLIKLEEQMNAGKNLVVSNTYAPRKKKLQALQQRVKKLKVQTEEAE